MGEIMKKVNLTLLAGLFIVLATLPLFQSCGQSFFSHEGELNAAQSQSGASQTDEDLEEDLYYAFDNEGQGVNTSAVATPTSSGDVSASAATYLLPKSVAPLVEGSRLNWTLDVNAVHFNNAVNGLAGQCTTKIQEFQANNQVVPYIYDEGLLPGDPKIEQMKIVKRGFSMMTNVAFCAYFASTASVRDQARNVIANYITSWNATYVGDGNPINERFFVTLFIAGDLLKPRLNATQITALKNLAKRIDGKEITFMSKLGANDGRRKNNWMTRHLMIRLFANITVNNTTNLSTVKSSINSAINSQYTAPLGFILSTCSNLRSVGSYGSYDLQERDAFLYHAAGLSELMPVLALAPQYINATPKSKLLTAINVMKPYVLLTKSHPEFKCTKVSYDLQKLALDPTLGNPWNPQNARVMFRYARLTWPSSVKPWTGSFVNPTYDPWFKILVAGRGDILF